jgi:DNA invertase Pin-like site-specific DNA recombinase
MLIGYARVSTAMQREDLQVDALQAAGCARLYVDHVTGAATERPELGRALDMLRAGDTLVVWRLDRLGRSLKHLIEIIEDCAQKGIGFRSLTEGIDTTTNGGRLVFHIFGALAEFERHLIRERTRAGLDAAKARGRHGGRPKAMNARTLEAARRMYEQGLTGDAISQELGISRASLYRYLAPTMQKGAMRRADMTTRAQDAGVKAS